MNFFIPVFFLACSVVVNAQQCLYNETMCACVFGSTAGSCYEKTGTAATTDLCSKRTCDAGWTCDCQGDYYCTQADIDVHTLVNPDDYLLTTSVPCTLTNQRTITSSGFQLGYFHPQFSDNGLLAGQCQIFAWWLDGVIQNDFRDNNTVTTENLATIKASLSDWNLLPLRSGSIIAFRWQGAPYSCYNSISELNVNGTILDTTDTSAVRQRYSPEFETDWFATDFVEGSNWNPSIASSTGDNYGIENNALTNTYWRIRIL